MKAIYTLFVILCVQCTTSNAANFSSLNSGSWSAPATWSITAGTDSDGIPDQDDDVVINSSHNVFLSVLQNYYRTLLLDIGGTLTLNSKAFRCVWKYNIKRQCCWYILLF
jgi:hypothetical protein